MCKKKKKSEEQKRLGQEKQPFFLITVMNINF